MATVFVPQPNGEFRAQYEQYAELDGRHYDLVGAADTAQYDRNEVGQMFLVRIGGQTIWAWPEELPGDWVEVEGPELYQ